MLFAIHRGKNMDLIKMGFLFFYGLIRGLPFIITAYFVISTKKMGRMEESVFQSINKMLLLVVGLGSNAIAFLGMHYWHYKDFEIIGYVKNIWGLNFYHHDVEYFIASGTLAMVLSLLLGIVLRALVDGERFWHVTKGQQYVAMAGGVITFILIIAGFEVEDYYRSHIRINEICSNKASFILDGNTLVEDYVELYNAGILPCEISGLFLSDDKRALHKMSLDGQIIPAGEVLVVPCKDDIDSFSIDNKGETVYLSDLNGNILEYIELGELGNDTSFARVENDKWEVRKCSPGKDNAANLEEKQVSQPVLSHASGFYDEAFELELTCSEDATIYYTLDGSVPDEGSYLYEEVIRVYDKSEEPNVWHSIQNVVPEWKEYAPDETPVDKAFLIRAIAVDNEGNKSKETVATYFVDKEQYEGKKVVSLIADPYDLFSDEIGIYVTGQRYDEWYLNGQEGNEPTPLFKSSGEERRANIEVFDMSEKAFQTNVGIRIQGGGSREEVEKRFSVFAREEYGGKDTLSYVFAGRETQPHSVLFRESLADVVCQQMMQNRGIPIQLGEPICVFLNGELLYVDRYLREKYSSQYFEDYYGVARDNLIICKNGYIDKGVETDILFYDGLHEFIEENDMTKENVYARFCEMVDVANYIDFLIANIYCANMDVSDNKNVVMWRSRESTDAEYSDGKWRWALFDMDAIEWTSLNYYEVDEIAAIDSFSQEPRYASHAYNQSRIYIGARKNEKFCEQFVLTCMDLINTNFAPKNAGKLLEQYGKDITWEGSFFEKRPAYMKEYLAKEFELTGSVETVTIVNKATDYGTVTVNSITPEMKDGSWSGEYFTDYPITVTAEAVEGYEFVGWSGTVVSDSPTIEISVEQGGIVLEAEFQKKNKKK